MGVQRMSTDGGTTTSLPTAYTDVPLNVGTSSTRLLTLSLDKNRTICGHLETFNIFDCPPFMALSYEWGARWPTSNILLEGKPHPIRKNLLMAIQAILNYRQNPATDSRYPQDFLIDETGTNLTYIWIDYICIDQANLAERTHQVNMMKEIYSKASLVLAWLGEATKTTNKYMRLFHHDREMLAGSPVRSVRDRMRTFRPLSSFLELNYFKRMWIIQELTLARRLVVMCGQDAIDGAVIENFLRSDPALFLTSPGGQVLTVKDYPYDLVMLIYRFCLSKCSDPRDMVYALLGIADSKIATFLPQHMSTPAEERLMQFGIKSDVPVPGFYSELDITADYKISPRELYLKIVKRNGYGEGGYGESNFSRKQRTTRIRLALRVPRDLLIPLDTRNDGSEEDVIPPGSHRIQWRPQWHHKALTATLEMTSLSPFADRLAYNSFPFGDNLMSTKYLAYVRSLNWEQVDSWPDNYRAMDDYSRSCSGSPLVRLEDLQYSNLRVVEWAVATLGGTMDERLAEGVAHMAGKLRKKRGVESRAQQDREALKTQGDRICDLRKMRLWMR